MLNFTAPWGNLGSSSSKCILHPPDAVAALFLSTRPINGTLDHRTWSYTGHLLICKDNEEEPKRKATRTQDSKDIATLKYPIALQNLSSENNSPKPSLNVQADHAATRLNSFPRSSVDIAVECWHCLVHSLVVSKNHVADLCADCMNCVLLSKKCNSGMVQGSLSSSKACTSEQLKPCSHWCIL